MNLSRLSRIDRLCAEAARALDHLDKALREASANDRADVLRLAPRLTTERINSMCDVVSRASSDIGVAVEEAEEAARS